MVEMVPWKVHTPKLFREILNTPGTEVLASPLNIMLGILKLTAQRAIELDDPKLHKLMVRLTLYEQADPDSTEYDPTLLKMIDEMMEAGDGSEDHTHAGS